MNHWFKSGIERFTRQGVQIPVNNGDMERLESAIGFPLPDDYKSVMCEFGGFEFADGALGGEPMIVIDSPYELELANVDCHRMNGMSIGSAFKGGFFPVGGIVGLCSLYLTVDHLNNPVASRCIGGSIFDNEIDADYVWGSFREMLLSYLSLLAKCNNPIIQFHRERRQEHIQKKRDDFGSILRGINFS